LQKARPTSSIGAEIFSDWRLEFMSFSVGNLVVLQAPIRNYVIFVSAETTIGMRIASR
jgi:hypothetical protein